METINTSGRWKEDHPEHNYQRSKIAGRIIKAIFPQFDAGNDENKDRTLLTIAYKKYKHVEFLYAHERAMSELIDNILQDEM